MTTTNEAYTRKRATTPAQPLPSRVVVLLTEARWIVVAALSIYLILILVSYAKVDPGWSHASIVPRIHNIGGRVGAWISDLLLFIFGASAWWLCVALLRMVWEDYRQLTRRLVVEAAPEPVHQYEKFIQGGGFVLLMVGSMGIEFLRMYSLKIPMPRAPGR